jgi:hypothetical protein
MDQYRGVRVGNVVDCEGGSIVIANYFSATAHDRAGKVVKKFSGRDRHMANFIDVVRSRKTADLCGPIDEGHVSSALCHLGNISHRLGHATPSEELRERIAGNPPLAEACGRMLEHLAANNVNLGETPATFGMPLAVAPGEERFIGETAPAANALLTREYRPPFVVPQLAET